MLPSDYGARLPKVAERPLDLSHHLQGEVHNLVRTIEQQRSDDIASAVRLLARASKLRVVGFGDNDPLAHFARALLIKVRPDVRMLPIGGFSVPRNSPRSTRTMSCSRLASAVEAEIRRHPGNDAGLIALDVMGRLHLANTALVDRRPDLGRILLEDPASGAAVAVLHNAIYPHQPLALLAASRALDCIAPADRVDLLITVPAGLPVEPGDEHCLHLDADARPLRVTVPDETWLSPRHEGALLDYGTAVRQDGVDVGRIVTEPYCIVMDRRISSLSGQPQALVAMRRIKSCPIPAARARSSIRPNQSLRIAKRREESLSWLAPRRREAGRDQPSVCGQPWLKSENQAGGSSATPMIGSKPARNEGD